MHSKAIYDDIEGIGFQPHSYLQKLQLSQRRIALIFVAQLFGKKVLSFLLHLAETTQKDGSLCGWGSSVITSCRLGWSMLREMLCN